MTVRLRGKNEQYEDLTAGQPYAVIGIEGDDYRILNDAGKPFLYPPEIFKVIDDKQPDNWVCERGDDGERYAYPNLLNSPGFFEDFFDNKPEAVRTFWLVVNQQLADVRRVA